MRIYAEAPDKDDAQKLIEQFQACLQEEISQ